MSQPLAGFRPTAEVGNLVCKVELPNDDDGADPLPGTRLVDAGYVYNNMDQIGEGTYGQVYQGLIKAGDQQGDGAYGQGYQGPSRSGHQAGRKVALKMIKLDQETREGFPITAIREIKILSNLRHENVINLREIVRSKLNRSNNFKGAIYMVFDYCSFDLTGYLEKNGNKLKPQQVKCLMLQLLKGKAHAFCKEALKIPALRHSMMFEPLPLSCTQTSE